MDNCHLITFPHPSLFTILLPFTIRQHKITPTNIETVHNHKLVTYHVSIVCIYEDRCIQRTLTTTGTIDYMIPPQHLRAQTRTSSHIITHQLTSAQIITHQRKTSRKANHIPCFQISLALLLHTSDALGHPVDLTRLHPQPALTKQGYQVCLRVV
jgi:hypothetical protein